MPQNNELTGALAVLDDARRKAVDDAKKRAVAQNVDYDTFKNMVSVAHLRPIQAASTSRTGVHMHARRATSMEPCMHACIQHGKPS